MTSLKYIMILTLALISSKTLRAENLTYNCDCVDTGYECDGGEKLYLTLGSQKSSIKMNSKDRMNNGTFTILNNPNYKPRPENVNFSQYNIIDASTRGKEFTDIKKSKFLIQNEMLTGSKTGVVKFQNYSESGGFWTWEHNCKLNR